MPKVEPGEIWEKPRTSVGYDEDGNEVVNGYPSEYAEAEDAPSNYDGSVVPRVEPPVDLSGIS